MATGEQKLRVLRALGDGRMTEAEVRRLVPGVPPGTVRAALMRAWELVEREEGPPIRYWLTEKGKRWVVSRMVEAGELRVALPHLSACKIRACAPGCPYATPDYSNVPEPKPLSPDALRRVKNQIRALADEPVRLEAQPKVVMSAEMADARAERRARGEKLMDEVEVSAVVGLPCEAHRKMPPCKACEADSLEEF